MAETGPFRPLILRAAGISKHFEALVALDGLDLDVPRHAVAGLIGPNGAGKTIFFDILTGLIRPSSGAVWFDGQAITHLPPARIAALGIARTFQGIRLFGNMTALENVLVGAHCQLRAGLWDSILRGPATAAEEAAAREQALALLRFTGLAGAPGILARNLPYGDQRRLELARALASEPTLLLLDEPTAGMNPQETGALMRLIARLRDERGLTILLIEHDMRVVMHVSDRITVLDYGVKIAEGPPAQVRADRRVIEAYLGRGAPVGAAPV